MSAVDFMSNPDFSRTHAVHDNFKNSIAPEYERTKAREETLNWISRSALEKFQRSWRE